MERVRVLVADDQALVREALCQILEPEFNVIGEADNGKAAIEETERLKPDLVLLDISLPIVSGMEAASRIRAVLPQIRIVLLTEHAGPEYVEAALERGVSAYCLKSAAVSELPEALHNAMRGDRFVSAALRAKCSVMRG
ncbi:MAG: response regulator transcription factor [Acidobacteriaceae bacterium]|nr:response regulator transcription factor [Acidobacteriaceae bacterium]